MHLSPDDVEALKSLGRYRQHRGTAEFFAVKKAGTYDFESSPRVPGLAPTTLQRLLAAELVHVQVQGQGGDIVTLTDTGERMVDDLLAQEG